LPCQANVGILVVKCRRDRTGGNRWADPATAGRQSPRRWKMESLWRSP